MNPNQWQHRGKIDCDAILQLHHKRLQQASLNKYERYCNTVIQIQNFFKKNSLSPSYVIKNDVVYIGEDVLNQKQKNELKKILLQASPWRKGPFVIYGVPIDAEWDSAIKWQRVKKQAGSLQGKAVLDIGCNNGYYLYQIAKQKPKLCLGIDPVIPYYQQYKILEGLCPAPHTDFALLGIEDLIHFDKVFDVVFCMGILYHHPNPIDLLKVVWKAMRPQGVLIIESQGIPGNEPYCLIPKGKYAGAPGNWFIPTESALHHMVSRSGFQYIQNFFSTPLLSEEQRVTEWAPHGGIDCMLDPKNPKQTKEGYPAPWRFYLKAYRAKKR